MVVAVLDWPEDISKEAGTLLADLAALDDALTGGDLAAAKEAAESVHSTQHDLSMAAYDWLGTQQAAAGGVGAVMAAIDLIETAGFHDMATSHAAVSTHAEIPPDDARIIKQVLAAARAVAWPAATADAAQAFIGALAEHDAAMVAADLARCQAAAEEVHQVQHDLSEAVYAWLAAQYRL
jgi:hypothetical protein